jgi:hypothetical protein
LAKILSELVHVQRSIFVDFLYESSGRAGAAILYQSLNS